MKTIGPHFRTSTLSLLAAAFAVWFASAPTASAASASWTGSTDGVWATTSNWSASPVPGSGNTATFSGAGNGNTTLDLGAGVTLSNLTFDTGTAAAYTIGSGGVGNQTLTLLTTGITQLGVTTGNNQTIDANILLGVDATASSYTFTNASPTRTLTLTGNVTGNTGGTGAAKTMTVRGAGNTTISGAISNGGATNVALTKLEGGTLTLSGNNTYTGITTLGASALNFGGTILLSGSGKLGTGAVNLFEGTLNFGNTTQTINGLTMAAGGGIAAGTANVLIGSGALNLGGNVTYVGNQGWGGAVISGSGGGVINLLGDRTFLVGDSPVSTEELTISAIIANGDLTARGITKAGNVVSWALSSGVLTLNAANTFTGTTAIAAEGGTLKLDFASSNAPTNNILYNSGTAGALSIGASTDLASTLLVQGKSNTVNSQALGNLTQTGGLGLASIMVNSGSSGTMNLSLGTIARAVGSSIAFTGPASGNITTTQADGRIAAATYTSGSGVTSWAGVTTGTLAAYTGDTLYTGGNITSNGTANLFITGTTSGNVIQGSGTTSLATLSMLDAADRTVEVGTGNAIRFSGPAGGVQNISTAGNLTIGSLGNAGSITSGTTAGQEFVITNGSASSLLTINSVITNNAGGSPLLNLTGPGRTVFTGNNTYTGVTNLNGGILEIQNNNALGTTAGATQIAVGATLGFSGNITTAENITIRGSGLGGGGALRNISGTNTLTGVITVGVARINSDAGTLAFAGSFSNNSNTAMTFGGDGNITLSTPISTGSPALTKDGNGTLTLLAANIVNGGLVTVNAGTLRYGANDAIGTGGVRVNGSTFDLSTFSDTVGAVTLSDGSIIGSGTLTGTGYALTNSGTISANLGSSAATLTKSGSGTATLSGNNTYTGTTTVSAGILTFGQTGAKASNTVTAAAAGTIGLGVGGAGYYSSANVDSLFANTLTGFSMNAASGVAIDTSAGDFSHATDQGGTRSLTKLGANALTLSGTSGYTGATVVSAGTLIIEGSLTSTSSASVASGAFLNVNGNVSSAVSVNGTLSGTGTVGAVTVASGGVLAPGNSAGILNATSMSGTSGAVLSMEVGKSTGGVDPIAGTNYDQVNSSGGVTLGGMTLDLTPIGAAPIDLGDKIFLVLNGSVDAVGGTFAGLAQDAVFTFNSKSYQISYVADWTGNYATSAMTGGNDIALLTVVPEPSTWALLGATGTILILFRRRRSQCQI